MINSLPFFLWVKSGNISRKFLTFILKIFDKNFERLQLVEFLKVFVWGEVTELYEGKEIERLGCLVDALLDVSISRENNLETIIKKINTLPDSVESGD